LRNRRDTVSRCVARAGSLAYPASVRRLPAPNPDPKHVALVAALRRRWGRLSDYERGVVVACAVDAALEPLEPRRAAWLRALAERLGVDLQPLAGRVLDVGPLPLRPPGRE
jgi:hypothetical protein